MRDRKIKVCYLRDTDKVCGPGKTMINTHRTIDQDAFSLTLCVTGGSEDGTNVFCESARKVGADVVHLKSGGFFDLGALFRLIKILKRRRIDILQTHDAQTRRLGVIASIVTGITHISSVHGWIETNQKRKMSVLLDKWLIRFSDKVIVMSEAMRAEIVSAGVPSDKVVTLYNAVLLDDYPIGDYSEEIRKEFGIAKDEKVIAFIGRLSGEKGPDVFIKAAYRIFKDYSNVRFLMVGDGPLRSSIEKSVDDLGLRSRVIFTGHRPEMAQIYAAIDILMISSFSEGLPNVLLEAFAYQRAVVSTRVGGVPEIISHGTSGFLVESGSVDGLVSHALLLLRNPEIAEMMGKNGRKFLEEELGFRKRTETLEALYRSIIIGHRPK